MCDLYFQRHITKVGENLKIKKSVFQSTLTSLNMYKYDLTYFQNATSVEAGLIKYKKPN